MKIAIYTGTFEKDKDGVARTLYELVRTIMELGHRVEIWTPDADSKEKNGFIVNITPSVPVPFYPHYRFSISKGKAKEQIEKFDPDIIQISTPDLIGYRFLKIGKKRDVPVVSAYHTDFPSYLKYYHLKGLNLPLWSYLKKFYSQCESVLVPTREMEKGLKDKGIDNTYIWSRGIRKDRFDPSFRSDDIRKKWNAENRTVILYCGRFVWYKDLDVVTKVYDELKRRKRSVKFVMVGSGPIRNDLEKHMKDATFTGYLKGRSLSSAYASGDIFLFPSTTETFGNVVQESLASGTPAVVSDVGGCSEIIRASNGGFIAEAGNVHSFTDKIEKLLDNKKVYEYKKKNGLEYAKKKTWNIINGDLIDHYEMIIKKEFGRDP